MSNNDTHPLHHHYTHMLTEAPEKKENIRHPTMGGLIALLMECLYCLFCVH